jgi:hypothetical protein
VTLSRFTLWEWAIGGACAIGFVILTDAPLPMTLAGLLVLAVMAAALARNVLAFAGTLIALWVALPLWASAIPGAASLPTLSAVIEPTNSTRTTPPPTTSTADSDTSLAGVEATTRTEGGEASG